MTEASIVSCKDQNCGFHSRPFFILTSFRCEQVVAQHIEGNDWIGFQDERNVSSSAFVYISRLELQASVSMPRLICAAGIFMCTYPTCDASFFVLRLAGKYIFHKLLSPSMKKRANEILDWQRLYINII